MLTDPPRPDLGVLPWSDWVRERHRAFDLEGFRRIRSCGSGLSFTPRHAHGYVHSVNHHGDQERRHAKCWSTGPLVRNPTDVPKR
jgi:hypothetical protein